jgi:hypothetical protein
MFEEFNESKATEDDPASLLQNAIQVYRREHRTSLADYDPEGGEYTVKTIAEAGGTAIQEAISRSVLFGGKANALPELRYRKS